MKYTIEMTFYDDDGEEVFNSFSRHDSIEDLERFYNVQKEGFTSLTEVTFGMFGEFGELPSDQDIEKIQQLQDAAPHVTKN